jgi:hypothetical protein
MRRFATAALALVLAGRAMSAQQVTLSGTGTFPALPSVLGLAPGTFAFSFLLPHEPSPLASIPEITFQLGGVTGVFTQGPTSIPLTGDLFFFTPAAGGMFEFDVGTVVLLAPFGTQIFTGSTSAPTFMPGSYVPTDPLGSGEASVASVNVAITQSTIPEPSAVLLLATGLLATAGAARRQVRGSAETLHASLRTVRVLHPERGRTTTQKACSG